MRLGDHRTISRQVEDIPRYKLTYSIVRNRVLARDCLVGGRLPADHGDGTKRKEEM